VAFKKACNRIIILLPISEKDNPKAIKKVFRVTVQIAKHFDLIGGKLIAGDSTKYRAQNSKKNNFNQKKIDRHVAYIDNKLDEYNQQLSEADEDKKQQIKKEIENAIINKSIEEEKAIDSIRIMAKQYRLNPQTISNAINELLNEGILFKKRGIGMFVEKGAQKKLKAKTYDEFIEEDLKR